MKYEDYNHSAVARSAWNMTSIIFLLVEGARRLTMFPQII